MRIAQLLTLAAIPAAAYGAHTITRANLSAEGDAPRSVADLDTGLGAMMAGLQVRGAPARAAAMRAALSDLDIEATVSLGEATCADDVDTRVEQVRYISGVRRDDNPDYLAASEALAAAQAELALLESDAAEVQARYASLLDEADAQDARTDALAEEVDHAAEKVERAQRRMAETRAQLEASRSAAAQIADILSKRSRLEAQIADLRDRIQQVSRATTPDTPDLTPLRAALEAAEIALAEARADVLEAQAAMAAARGQGLSKPERAELHRALSAARDAEGRQQGLVATARAELTAASSAHPAPDALDDLRRSLRRAEGQLSKTPPPSHGMRQLAAQAGELEAKLQRHHGAHRAARHSLADIEGRFARQEARSQQLRSALSAQTAEMEQRQARLQAQQTLIIEGEAALAGTPSVLSRTLRDELSYPVETWTRTCGVEATVRWLDDLGEAQMLTFGAEAQDSDQAHDAWARAGVEADPKDLGRDDRARIAEADGLLAEQIRTSFSPALAITADNASK